MKNDDDDKMSRNIFLWFFVLIIVFVMVAAIGYGLSGLGWMDLFEAPPEGML